MVAEGIIGDVSHIGAALGSLFGEGGFEGFFYELFQAVDGIGVFLIIYALMMFISRITLFRSDEHKKFSHMFGIGVALIGITNNAVYNLLTSLLGGSFLTFVIIIIVVFGVIILLNVLNKHRHVAGADKSKAATRHREAESEEVRAFNEVLASTRLAGRERSARADTSNIERDLENTTHNAFLLIEEMQHQLSRAQTLQSQGQSTKDLRQGILGRISAFTSALRHEHDDLNRLREDIRSLENLSIKEFKFSKDEENKFKHLESHFKGDREEDFEKHEIHEIEEFGRHVLALIKKKEDLLKQMQSLIDTAIDNEKQTEALQKRFVSDLENGTIGEAIATLSSIRNHLNNIQRDNEILQRDTPSLDQLIQQITGLEQREENLLNKLKKTTREGERSD